MSALIPLTLYTTLVYHTSHDPEQPVLWFSESIEFPKDESIVFHPSYVNANRGDGSDLMKLYEAFVVALQAREVGGTTVCQLKDIQEEVWKAGWDVGAGVTELAVALARY